jgi:hypothetical protein
MYTFAVLALLALAIVKLVDFLADTVEPAARLRSPLTFVLGVAATIALDFSLFEGFGISIRDRVLGVWVTGLVVAGLTIPWRALFSYVTHDRALADETLGHGTHMRQVA